MACNLAPHLRLTQHFEDLRKRQSFIELLGPFDVHATKPPTICRTENGATARPALSRSIVSQPWALLADQPTHTELRLRNALRVMHNQDEVVFNETLRL